MRFLGGQRQGPIRTFTGPNTKEGVRQGFTQRIPPQLIIAPAIGANVDVTGVEVLTETGVITATGGALVNVTGVEVLTETGEVFAIGDKTVFVSGVEIETETGKIRVSGGIPVKLILARRRATSWPPFLQGRRGWKGGSLGQKWL